MPNDQGRDLGSPAPAELAPDAPVVEIQPVDTDGVVSVTVVTIAWAVAFVVLLPFRHRLAEHGTDWWVWTCAVGFALGLGGTWFCRRRRAAIRASGHEG